MAQPQQRSDDFACGCAPLQVAVQVVASDSRAPFALAVRLWAPTELQRASAAACRSWLLSSRDCAALAVALAQRAAPLAAAEAQGLPPPQHKPTPAEPFVFLHHEKCAGTSLRRVLARSALQATGPNSFHVPCFDPANASGPLIDLPPGTHRASCMSFDLSPVPPQHRGQLAVVAGHFAWGVWHQGLSDDPQPNGAQDYAPHPRLLRRPLPVAVAPRVFVMLREPVARAVSLYYERVQPQSQVPLNALSDDELAFYLAHFRGSAFGQWRDEGFQDAACKLMCGAQAHKGKAPREVDLAAAAQLATSVRADVASARLRHCVVGLTHRWADTKKVVAFWFPWVDFAAAGEVRENAGRGDGSVETRATLRPAHLAQIEAANRCDLALYAAAEAQFDEQLQILAATWA
jgi:hypothetical protein